jgi:hypothetical protein
MQKRFAQGKFNLKNPQKYLGNKTPIYRSGWEFAFMKFLDENANIISWASESIKIPYRNPLTGKHTIYVPDFFMSYLDRNGKTHAELIEVKPANQSVKEQLGKSVYNQAHYIMNMAKWEAARAFCKQKGINFRIVTEQEMFMGTKGDARRR